MKCLNGFKLCVHVCVHVGRFVGRMLGKYMLIRNHQCIKDIRQCNKDIALQSKQMFEVRTNRTTNKAEMLDENIGRFAPAFSALEIKFFNLQIKRK